jgi:hypothetical protein
VALAPFLIDIIARKRKTFWVIAALTAGVLFSAYCADKGWRDFQLNFGSGLCLLLGVDYFVSRSIPRVDKADGGARREDGQDVFAPSAVLSSK